MESIKPFTDSDIWEGTTSIEEEDEMNMNELAYMQGQTCSRCKKEIKGERHSVRIIYRITNHYHSECYKEEIEEEIMKDKAAQELAAKRWKKTTAEERSKELQGISKQGWTEENRAKRLENAGRPINPDRCPCGKMTRERAIKRNHKC